MSCHKNCFNCLGPEIGDCVECKEPYVKVNHVSFLNRGKCFDCFNEWEKNEAKILCREIQFLSLKVESRARDGYSSRSVFINFDQGFVRRKELESLNHNLTDYFEVKILKKIF